jgi:hypothetical protein
MAKTSIPQVKIVNVETGEEIIRDANAEELAQMEIDAVEATAHKQAAAAQAEADAAKASEKEALLARLGITADEAKLLLA